MRGTSPRLRLRSGLLALFGCAGLALGLEARAEADLPESLPPGTYEPLQLARLELPKGLERRRRDEALARARVWREPDRPIAEAPLGRNPPGVPEGAEVVCKFLPRRASGRTPKFECVHAGGEVLRVKYGASDELHTELAATRLLDALGFGADRTYAVQRVRCFGCPSDPFVVVGCLGSPFEERRSQCELNFGVRKPTGDIELAIDYTSYTDFDRALVERRMPGLAIETDEVEGWSWKELERVDPTRGGATRPEIDALRLMAVLLNNWDTKASNQRLMCLPGGEQKDGRCAAPFAMMHDVGATFGGRGSSEERKLDLEAFRALPVWKDPARCEIGTYAPPLRGATFEDVRVTERGRRLLAGLVTQLRPDQLRELFVVAGFGEGGGDVDAWVSAFQHRVRQIADRPPCPNP